MDSRPQLGLGSEPVVGSRERGLGRPHCAWLELSVRSPRQSFSTRCLVLFALPSRADGCVRPNRRRDQEKQINTRHSSHATGNPTARVLRKEAARLRTLRDIAREVCMHLLACFSQNGGEATHRLGSFVGVKMHRLLVFLCHRLSALSHIHPAQLGRPAGTLANSAVFASRLSRSCKAVHTPRPFAAVCGSEEAHINTAPRAQRSQSQTRLKFDRVFFCSLSRPLWCTTQVSH